MLNLLGKVLSYFGYGIYEDSCGEWEDVHNIPCEYGARWRAQLLKEGALLDSIDDKDELIDLLEDKVALLEEKVDLYKEKSDGIEFNLKNMIYVLRRAYKIDSPALDQVLEGHPDPQVAE